MLAGKPFIPLLSCLAIDSIYYFIQYLDIVKFLYSSLNGFFMKVTQLCFALLCLVVLLQPAQANLIIIISPDGSGNARMRVVGSGSTTSTTRGNWDTSGASRLSGINLPSFGTNPFNNLFGKDSIPNLYSFQDFEIDGFQVTAGTQTRTLNRFTFDDDGDSGDDLVLSFGDGTNATTWDTDGEGVGAISVLETAYQTIRFRTGIGFSSNHLPGETLRFNGNFNVGFYSFESNDDNAFWGGSNSEGITLIVSSDVIPEPTSALLLLLPATALLGRKRFC